MIGMAKINKSRFIAPRMLLYIGGTMIVIGSIITLVFSGLGSIMWARMRAGLFLSSLGIIGLFAGILILIAASELSKRKESNTMWLVIALVSSLLSIVDGGGFIVGALLAFIGSVLGLIELDIA
jgi:asparagine N-glycosylation enzyme membrane subunit Stt3